jgi:two-component system chemotaxis family response regulator WspR
LPPGPTITWSSCRTPSNWWRIRYHSRSYLTLLQRRGLPRLRVSQQQLLDTNLMLQRLMNSDGLTGLSNRRHFDEYLSWSGAGPCANSSSLSLLMIDVDYFKAYNDSFGHLAGDEALRQVAEAIRGPCSRPTDLPARYGGEEFALVLPNTSPGGARLVAEKLRQTVRPASAYCAGGRIVPDREHWPRPRPSAAIAGS